MTAPPVVFDTDGGVDDCTALWWGLSSRAVDIVAVTTVFGNVGIDQVNRNVAKLLVAADRPEIPIAVGADAPLGPTPVTTTAQAVHGADGLGGYGPPDVPFTPARESADAMLVRITAERPGEVTVVAVGPLTNVARALRRDPAFAVNVRELVVMGGVIQPPGNVLPTVEFNVGADVEAAAEVVAAPWARRPLLVPLDATHVATLGESERALLAERRTAAARFLAEPIEAYWSRSAIQTPDGSCPTHDTVALMAVEDASFLEIEEFPLAVDTGGSAAWGQTVADLRVRLLDRGAIPDELVEAGRTAMLDGSSVWRVAMGADAARFRSRFRPMLVA